jgi:HlyD family secretion protein
MKEKLPFKPTTTLIIALAAAAGLASLLVTVYSLSRSQSRQPPASPTPVAAQKKSAAAVSALGRLEPQGEVIKVAPPPSLGGAKVAKLLVREGDFVEAGQVIAILDNYDLRQKAVKLAEEDEKVARANLNIVKAGAKKGEIKAKQAEIARIQAELRGEIQRNQAKIARIAAELDGEKRTQIATIARIKAKLGNAEREFRRYQQLAKDGAISDSDLDTRRLSQQTAREELEEARARFNQTIATLSEELSETRADSDKTAATLKKQILEATADLERVAEVRGVDVAKSQAEVERAAASLEQTREEWDLTSVRAPFSGQILKIKTYPGENVAQSAGIVELGRTGQMLAVAEVYESDIGRVRVGQQATVTSENATFPGKLDGTVQQIGLQIGKKDVLESDPAADIDVRVIEVRILLDSESSKRVAGLTNAKVIVQILS